MVADERGGRRVPGVADPARGRRRQTGGLGGAAAAATRAVCYVSLFLAVTTTFPTPAGAVELVSPCATRLEVDTNATLDRLYFMLFFDKTGSTSMADVVRQEAADWFVDAGCRRPEVPAPPPKNPRVWWRWAMYGGFDNCALLAPRPCAYVTVLRDPVARLLSAYHYFCRACAEKGRQCGREHPDTLKCPHMTLEAYAAAFQDLYTRAFSHATVPPDGSYYTLSLGEAAQPEDLEAAKSWISSRRVLILFTEDLEEEYPLRAVGKFLDIPAIGELKQMVHANPASRVANKVSRRLDAPSGAAAGDATTEPPVLAEIETRFFAYDFRLYGWLRSEYVQPVEPDDIGSRSWHRRASRVLTPRGCPTSRGCNATLDHRRR